MTTRAKNRIAACVLSVLILLCTPAVRFALGEESEQQQDVETMLREACLTYEPLAGVAEKPEDEAQGEPESAADAAVLLRYRYGLLSALPHEGEAMRSKRLIAAFDAAQRVMEHTLNFDMEAFAASLKPFDGGVYASYAEHATDFAALANEFNDAIEQASQTCMIVLSRDLRAIETPLTAAQRQTPHYTWQEIAALYCVYGEDLPAVIAHTAKAQRTGDLVRGVTLQWGVPSFDQTILYGEQNQVMSAKFALAYLKTVFDDKGALVEPTDDVFDEAYVATVAHPLPGCTIKDGWYLSRSNGTRRHMGTDILARARTEILSATDGEVLYVGYMAIPGNYVVIRDPFGYEYHYYHMNEKSTYVKAGDTVVQGQVIGRVGNTGNSAAYHLHLTIISPDHVYLNPYDLYAQAQIEPLRR